MDEELVPIRNVGGAVCVWKCGRWHDLNWECELVRSSISAAGERRLKFWGPRPRPVPPL